MPEVPIPDPLYKEAKQKADENGLSLEMFVAEAVRLHLDDEAKEPDGITLTAEQVQIIRQGQEEMKAGKFLTLEQMEERSAARRATWLAENQL